MQETADLEEITFNLKCRFIGRGFIKVTGEEGNILYSELSGDFFLVNDNNNIIKILDSEKWHFTPTVYTQEQKAMKQANLQAMRERNQERQRKRYKRD